MDRVAFGRERLRKQARISFPIDSSIQPTPHVLFFFSRRKLILFRAVSLEQYNSPNCGKQEFYAKEFSALGFFGDALTDYRFADVSSILREGCHPKRLK